MNWHDAHLACQSQGGHLAHFKSTDDNDQVQALGLTGDYFWIGLYDTSENGSGWAWTDGTTTFIDQKWNEGAPYGEACGEIH